MKKLSKKTAKKSRFAKKTTAKKKSAKRGKK